MKIVILGRGYIGMYLARYMSKKHDAVCVNRALVDYHDTSTLDGLLKVQKPDVVFSAFGFTGRPNIDQAELMKSDCWNLNVNIPLKVNRVCAERNIGFVHISSGCVFDGYERQWKETDDPNFGMFHDSSFYSKTKHAFELVSGDLPGTVVRIRMPFSGCRSERNYLMKLIGYSNIIDMVNSRTCVEDMCISLGHMIEEDGWICNKSRATVHLVNPNPLSTSEVISVLRSGAIENNHWKIISLDKLSVKAPRSNCIIENSNFSFCKNMKSEIDSLRECVASMVARGCTDNKIMQGEK